MNKLLALCVCFLCVTTSRCLLLSSQLSHNELRCLTHTCSSTRYCELTNYHGRLAGSCHSLISKHCQASDSLLNHHEKCSCDDQDCIDTTVSNHYNVLANQTTTTSASISCFDHTCNNDDACNIYSSHTRIYGHCVRTPHGPVCDNEVPSLTGRLYCHCNTTDCVQKIEKVFQSSLSSNSLVFNCIDAQHTCDKKHFCHIYFSSRGITGQCDVLRPYNGDKLCSGPPSSIDKHTGCFCNTNECVQRIVSEWTTTGHPNKTSTTGAGVLSTVQKTTSAPITHSAITNSAGLLSSVLNTTPASTTQSTVTTSTGVSSTSLKTTEASTTQSTVTTRTGVSSTLLKTTEASTTQSTVTTSTGVSSTSLKTTEASTTQSTVSTTSAPEVKFSCLSATCDNTFRYCNLYKFNGILEGRCILFKVGATCKSSYDVSAKTEGCSCQDTACVDNAISENITTSVTTVVQTTVTVSGNKTTSDTSTVPTTVTGVWTEPLKCGFTTCKSNEKFCHIYEQNGGIVLSCATRYVEKDCMSYTDVDDVGCTCTTTACSTATFKEYAEHRQASG